jgi:glycosyltransferase 2 family protein
LTTNRSDGAGKTVARLKFVFRCFVSGGLILFIAGRVDWRVLGSILERIDWRWAAIGSLLTGVVIAALACRWRIFLAQQNIPATLRHVISLTWAGQCFNSLLPGSTGGDFFKVYQACSMAPDRKAAAAGTVVVDRLSALFALLVLAAVAFVFEPAPLRALAADRMPAVSVWSVAAVLAAALGVGMIVFRALRSREWFGRLGRTLRAVGGNLHLNAAVSVAFGLAFLIHLLNFLAVYLFARSLRIDISYAQVLMIMPVVLLLVMLPITINGHGLRELLLIGYFSHMNLRIGGRTDVGYQEAAVALSVLMVANDFVWSLPGGIHYLTRMRLARELPLQRA